uniref:Fatty-acid amide hydrolase 1 n=1 Tax=Pseudonaja textilis TaxID=8673 RepID=A0A670XXW1_PSETE
QVEQKSLKCFLSFSVKLANNNPLIPLPSLRFALSNLREVLYCALSLQNPGLPSDEILSLPLVELVEKLKEDTLSPDVVLYTYMEKALTVTKEVNCVRHFIPECEPFLQQLKTQKEKGLLYGVPVSIKDHIAYKGHLTTCGFSHFLDVEEEDSVLVKVLKKQGANPFVFTNVPQSLFNYDCSNVVFGQTVNPFDHKRTPGGSSGGEGALIAGGGSILGFGSDLGGSIRLPSSFCGLCGLKPTAGRLSNKSKIGLAVYYYFIHTSSQVLGTIGPMAKDVDSLALCMKALLCDYMFQLDPTVPPMPFNEEIYSSSTPLRIGYYDTDGYFLLPPCMRRAVHKTRKLLQEAGHTVLSSLDFVRTLTTIAVWAQVYQKKFIEHWKKDKLDVVLCPVLGPAFFLGYPSKILAAISNTMLYNGLNFPAGVVPVTTVTEADEEELAQHRGIYGDYWDRILKQAVKDAVGLPVAVQCVALPWQEELCLRFMKEVEML